MRDLAGARVLVTGAAGFLGANLTRELVRQGAEVHALVRSTTPLWRISEVVSDVALHTANLENMAELRRVISVARPELIMHLAVCRADQSPEERQATLQANVAGTANLLEATAPLDYRRFLYLGSSLEYRPSDEPLREDASAAPMTFYGATKTAATVLCQQVARADGRAIVVLRPFQIFGFWEPPNRLISTAIAAALRDRDMALTMPGFRRDWLFVNDAVDGFLRALEADNVAGEVINIGSGKDCSNEEVVALVREITGSALPVRIGEHPARPWDASRRVADIAKARRLLGWTPRHTLRDGLVRTVDWYRHHGACDERTLPAP